MVEFNTFKDLEAEIKKILPKFRINSFGSDGENNLYDINYQFWDVILKGSEFEVPRPIQLIHYTPDLVKLSSIINEGGLRMYDLRRMEDTSEAKYGIKALEIPEINDLSLLENEKGKCFCLSTCDFSSSEEDFGLWQLYGGKGFGAALIFELDLFGDYFRFNTLAAKVNYTKEKLNDLQKIGFCLKELDDKHNYSPEKWMKLLAPLMTFFKQSHYNYEKEIRILSLNKDSDFQILEVDKKIKREIGKDGKSYFYKTLVFKKTADDRGDLKLKSIIMGPNNDYNQVLNIHWLLNDNRMMGSVEVRQSKFIN